MALRCLNVVAVCLALAGASSALAADLVEVLPVTSRILQVHIHDGKVKYAGNGQPLSAAVVYHEPVNLTAAMTASNYTVQSSDDANFSTARAAVNIGRKSRPLYFNDHFDSTKPTFVMGHRIYIELPASLTQGRTYTVRLLNNLTNNRDSVSFTYDVNRIRSETVHVNQVGFAPSAVKMGYLSHWMGSFSTATHGNGGLNLDDRAGTQFRIINYATGATAFTGTISKRMAKTVQETTHGNYYPQYNYSHADVWECDFTNLATAGEYVLVVDGIGCSYPFEIGANVNREPFYYAMKGMFAQRQGIVKDMGEGRIHPRDHHPDDIAWKYDANWAGGEDTSGFNTASPRVYGIWGHYHDAGDWDHYVHHARVPMHLMLLYDMQPSKFRDGDVGNRYKLHVNDASWINEGTNGLPDLLDEAVWLLNFKKRAKDRLVTLGLGTGGVPGYTGRDGCHSNQEPAWQDPREWYISRENVEATYHYATMSAWYAECLNKFHRLTSTGDHPSYASWKTEAINAWNWANARETTNSSHRELASALLYRITGDTAYQTIYKNLYTWQPNKDHGEWAGPEYWDFAMAVYAMLPSSHPGLDTAFQTTVRDKIISKANLKSGEMTASGFRAGTERNQFFQLGTFSTPRPTYVAVAHHLTGDSTYLNAIQHAVNYQFGGNQLNTVYMTGLGEQPLTATFTPSAWFLNPAGSIAYEDEMFDGHSTYFGAVDFWFFTSIYSEYQTRKGAFPALEPDNTWPEAESAFFNRHSIQGSEYTIHQNNNYSIYTYGYVNALTQTSTSTYVPNARPTVSLNLTEGQSFPGGGGTLTASTSADVRLVKYYYDWHYIGESADKANNFPVFWDPTLSEGATTLVSAVAYDDRGRITRWSDAGDKNVTIGSGGGTAPAAPTNLAATAGDGQVSLTWSASSGASSYNVKRSTTSGSSYITIASPTTTSYTNTGLTNGTTYYYVVSAVNSNGESGNSNQASATPQSMPTGSGTISQEIWTGISGNEVSLIPLSTTPNQTGTLNSFEAATDWSDNYGQRVRGYLTAPQTGSYTFWIASDDNSELWLSTNDQPANKVLIASVTSWTASRAWNTYASQKSAAISLTAGQRYYIEALQKEGNGGDNLAVGWAKPGQSTTAPSEVIPGSQLSPWDGGGTQPPAAPTSLTATPGDGQVSLSWSTSSGATSYNVKRSTTNGGPYVTIASPTTTSYTNTGLTNGTTYYYVVTAANSGGESGNSNQASATPTAPTGGTANIAAGSATIDATVESAWSSATAYTIGNITGTISSTTDLSGTFKGLWDSTNLYLLAEVTDDDKQNDSTNPWDDDSVELYLDGNNDKATTYDTNDRQYVFGWGDTAAVEAGGRSATGVTFAKADPTSTTYRIEAKVPWATLGVTASSGKNIGLDVHLNDDDAGGVREGKRQWNDIADTAWSNPSVFGIGTLQSGGTAPAAPTGLAATAGDAQVALSWNASSGATSYNVKRSTTSGSGYSTIASPTTTSYTNTGLTNGTTYYYVVSAVNSNGESGNSSQASATPTAPGGTGTGLTGEYYNNMTLTAPIVLTRTDATVNFGWGSGSPGTGVNVDNFSVRWTGQVQATVSGTYTFSTESDDGVRLWVNGTQVISNWTDHGPTIDTSAGVSLTTGTKYDITMEYYENGGGATARLMWTPPGGTRVIIPQSQLYPSGGSPQPPAAPSGLAATAGDAQVALSWNASTGATSYNVKRSTTSGSGYATIASPTTTSYTNTGLTNGTTYYYVVSAVNSVGESANSGQVSATPMGGQVAAPSFSPAAGTYTGAQSVTISSATSGASIRFTTDGSNPTSTTGTLYSGPVSISSTTTLKAIAYKTGMTDSTVTSGTYTINTSSSSDATIAAGTATIDGAVDAAWSAATSRAVANVTVGTVANSGDLSATWKGLWDASYLYVLTEVTDNDKRNDSTNPWEDDGVEVYIDGANNKTTTYDANDAQYVLGWNDTSPAAGANTAASKLTGVTMGQSNPSTTTYKVEVRIPWTSIGVTAAAGNLIGFDVHVNDDDSGTTRDAKLAWYATADNSWSNPSTFATADLAAGTVQPPAAPTGLSATAGDGQVALSWSASSGATSYNVKRSTTSGSGYTTIASPTTTSYTNTGLTNGTTYYYVVSAVNSGGQSANSSQVSATPTAPSSNLLVNPGLESGNTGWGAWTADFQIINEPANARSGSWCIRIGPSDTGGYQQVAAVAGASYTLSAWGKTTATDGRTAMVGYKFKDSAGTQIGPDYWMASFTTSSYQQRTATFTVPAGATIIEVIHWFGGGSPSAYMYADDYSLIRN